MREAEFIEAMNSGDAARVRAALHSHFGGNGGIHYGLQAIKGVGAEAARTIVEARQANGDFRSLADFVDRVDLRRVGRKALEALAKAGAFDALEPNRAAVLASVPDMMQMSARVFDAKASGQTSLFE